MALTNKKAKVYSYDQMMNVLESLRNNFALEPDVRKQVIETIRRSADRYEVDLSPYEEFLQ